MFRQTFTIFALMGTLGTAACTKEIRHEISSPAPVVAPVTPPTPATPAPAPAAAPSSDGASSGGGGYVTKNSKKILELVVADLSFEVEHASPSLFSDLPKDWTQKKLADVIKNIRLSSTKDVQRDNSDLLFNYGKDEKGPYIEALRPFFAVYGQLPVRFSSPETDKYLKDIILDLRHKLLHEVAHLLGKDEVQAETYGLDLLRKIEMDFYICMVPREQVITVPNVLWVSPAGISYWTPSGGGRSRCDGPSADCFPDYSFNWIHSNNWIYHQAKNQMIQSSSGITYHSHLDPQPYENLKEEWAKSDAPPGVKWEKRFPKIDPSKDRYGYSHSMMTKSNPNDLQVEYTEPLDYEGKQRPSAIGIIADFATSPEGNKIFKSGRARVPLMKINFEPPNPEVKTGYNNPLAPSGEYVNGNQDFILKCEYAGLSNSAESTK
jgi:hypothetical protein